MHQSTVIFIIDDNPMDSLLVEKLLREELTQVDIYVFPAAQLALERLKKMDPFSNQYPQLILVDEQMPGIDGWQFLESFTNMNQGREQSCKVILLACLEGKADIAKKLTYQIELLSKPISKSEFTHVIKPGLEKMFV